MDASPALLRPQGSARTRLLVDDRVVVVDAHGGTEPVARATPAFGEGPDNLAPRRAKPLSVPAAPVKLLGREAELADIAEALADGDTVVLSAGPGYGKTALLHHLAAEENAYPDGAVLLSARGRTVGDVQFEIFRSVFEVPGRRPGAADLRRHLADVKALLLIDDVLDPVPLARALVEAAPRSRVVLATESEPVGGGLLGGFGDLGLAGFGDDLDGEGEDVEAAGLELDVAADEESDSELADEPELSGELEDVEDEAESESDDSLDLEVDGSADEESDSESADEPELIADLDEDADDTESDDEPELIADLDKDADDTESDDEPQLIAEADDVADEIESDDDTEAGAELAESADVADDSESDVEKAESEVDAELTEDGSTDEPDLAAADVDPDAELAETANAEDSSADEPELAVDRDGESDIADHQPELSAAAPPSAPSPTGAKKGKNRKKRDKRKPTEGSGDHE